MDPIPRILTPDLGPAWARFTAWTLKPIPKRLERFIWYTILAFLSLL